MKYLMPKISVIVPVYNMALYLDDCIKSILIQDFDSFELLLVNDGSKDNSGGICDMYAGIDARVKVFHQENGGVTSARRLGVENARGEYICFVDGDDTLPMNALTLLYDRTKEYDLDILVTAKNFINFQKVKKIYNKIVGIMSSSEHAEGVLKGFCFGGPHGRLIKNTLFKSDVLSLPRDIIQNEDLIMNIRLGAHAQKIGIFNDIITYNYCRRGNSASSKRINFALYLKIIKEYEQAIKCIDGEHQNALTIRKVDLINVVNQTDKIKNKREIIEILNEAKKIDGVSLKTREKIYINLYPQYKVIISLYYKIRRGITFLKRIILEK
jgi:glycosyltransferase involved in cell wall biosynthesis